MTASERRQALHQHVGAHVLGQHRGDHLAIELTGLSQSAPFHEQRSARSLGLSL